MNAIQTSKRRYLYLITESMLLGLMLWPWAKLVNGFRGGMLRELWLDEFIIFFKAWPKFEYLFRDAPVVETIFYLPMRLFSQVGTATTFYRYLVFLIALSGTLFYITRCRGGFWQRLVAPATIFSAGWVCSFMFSSRPYAIGIAAMLIYKSQSTTSWSRMISWLMLFVCPPFALMILLQEVVGNRNYRAMALPTVGFIANVLPPILLRTGGNAEVLNFVVTKPDVFFHGMAPANAVVYLIALLIVSGLVLKNLGRFGLVSVPISFILILLTMQQAGIPVFFRYYIPLVTWVALYAFGRVPQNTALVSRGVILALLLSMQVEMPIQIRHHWENSAATESKFLDGHTCAYEPTGIILFECLIAFDKALASGALMVRSDCQFFIGSDPTASEFLKYYDSRISNIFIARKAPQGTPTLSGW